ncbi:hypothetical protein BZA05DRAFT_475414 [Tricharina praecox]|uniref:uncharacterized protein n=1 Tax=Tricharina praecox TaxID=43433 RepID=UPI002220A73C|nr:uncharacterized protein BZA05DRAFT_475414 [Tricharina praecox]KAI5848351.1 hypothetical protein BZA05DRAFT_475414 [Tricharina praecox]
MAAPSPVTLTLWPNRIGDARNTRKIELKTRKVELEARKIELEARKVELEERQIELEARKVELETDGPIFGLSPFTLIIYTSSYKLSQSITTYPKNIMKLLALALSLFAGVNAVAIPADMIETRGDAGEVAAQAGGVYFCNGAEFTDKCKWFPMGKCVNLAPYGMQGQISSIAPNKGVRCTFYVMPNCLLGQAMKYKVYRHPGEGNVGNEWNDKFWSFQCY